MPALERVANEGVMTADDLGPCPVARGRLALGRTDDVGEENGPEDGVRRLGAPLPVYEGATVSLISARFPKGNACGSPEMSASSAPGILDCTWRLSAAPVDDCS